MPTKIIPVYSEEFGVFYIEAEDKAIQPVKKKNDDDGTVRVSASRDEKIVEEGGQKFEKAVGIVGFVAKTFLSGMENLRADSMELEMGMSFNGEFGLPFITKASAESTFKVTVKWENGKAKKQH